MTKPQDQRTITLYERKGRKRSLNVHENRTKPYWGKRGIRNTYNLMKVKRKKTAEKYGLYCVARLD